MTSNLLYLPFIELASRCGYITVQSIANDLYLKTGMEHGKCLKRAYKLACSMREKGWFASTTVGGESRSRLVGQFSWIFNKDSALRVKRPVPQLG